MSTDTEGRVTFEALRADVERGLAMVGLALDQLDEADEKRGVQAAAQGTGRDPAVVERMIRAFRIARELRPAPRRTRATLPATAAAELAGWAAVTYAALDRLPAGDTTELSRLDPAAVRAGVERAMTVGTVATEHAGALDGMLESLATKRIEEFLAPKAAAESHPAAVILGVLAPTNAVRTAVAELALQYGADAAGFWEAVEGDKRLTKSMRRALRTSTELLELSGRNVALLEQLVAGDEGDTLEPARLAALDSAGWAKVLDVAGDGTEPDDPQAAAALAGARQYARTLAEAVERRYPNERFAASLSRDTNRKAPLGQAREDMLAFLANNLDFHLVDTPLAGLLTGDPKADAARLKGLKTPSRTIELLAAYQRLHRLLPPLATVATTVVRPGEILLEPDARYDITSRLVNDGFTSALSIAALPRTDFLRRYVDLVGGEAVLDAIYRHARLVTDASLQFAIGIRNWAQPALPRALPRVVTWADTFGAAVSCECGSCESIHGPAAYLFDCLHFLEDAGVPWLPTSPLAVLEARRPDLLQLALTCDNTGTRVPYIDLVNERLEQLVAPEWFQSFMLPATVEAALDAQTVSAPIRDAFRDSVNTIELAADAELFRLGHGAWHLLDRATMYAIRKNGTVISVASACVQTSGNEAELRAAPQHTIPAAYRKLELKVYPWSMPFSLAWAEIVEYLARLDVRPNEVLEAFQPPSTPSSSRVAPFEARDAVAGAYLGLSPTEFQIIAGQKLAGDGPITIGVPNDYPQDFWGYARAPMGVIPDWDGTQVIGPWTMAVWRVPEFLHRSGLSYVELLELLDCYFINPASTGGVGGRTLFIASRDPNDPASCDLAKLEIRGVPPAGEVALATKIHRFVRLQRRLGWSVIDLDRVLVALGVTTLDRDALVAMSIVERLRRRTGVSLAELAGWLGEIDHAAYGNVRHHEDRLASFYDETFRIPDAADPGSPFNASAEALATTIPSHKVRLAARLGISEPELDRLRNDPRVLPVGGRDALTLATLSTLARYASLARCSGVGIDEVLRAVDVFGFAPFTVGPAAAGIAGPIDRALVPLRFLEALSVLAEAELAPSTAAYLFVNDGQASDTPGLDAAAMTDAAITDAVRALVDAVQPVLAELVYPADATGAVVATELAKCGWSDVAARQAGSFFAGQQVYTVGLAGTAVPDAVRPRLGRLVYDEVSATLGVTGALSAAERDELLQIPGITMECKAAIVALFDAPRDFARTELGYVVPPEYAVPLTRMPGGLRLPATLAVVLKFDADRRALVFRGDRRLLALVEYPPAPLDAEWTAFRAAIEALRASPLPASVSQDPPAAENRFFASEAALENLLNDGGTADQRCAFALERIARGRWRLESERAAIAALSATGLEAAVLRVCRPVWAPLVIDPATSGPSELVRAQTAFTSSPTSPIAAIVRRLYKIGVLSKSLTLPPSAVLWLLRNSVRLGGPDLFALPAQLGDPAISWDRIVPLFDFAYAYRGFVSSNGSLLDVFDLVLAGPPVAHADWWKLVARIKGWEGRQLWAITGSPAFPSGFDRPQFYRRLLVKMKLAEQCGVSVGVLMDWSLSLGWSAGGLWSGGRLASVATEVKSGVRQRVGRERWLQIATEINDPLRERRRDALLAYVLAAPNPWDGRLLRNADELFDYLLIDPQMASCMLTSRLRLAIGSVQSFVQRALMGLEPTVGIAADHAEEWNTWRKQYRVWEANRKVLLYPENWLEPELRDDKSPLFREVESRLLQSALTPDTASRVVGDYVDGMSTLSDLEIVGAYRQAELVNGVEVLAVHLVGRSHSHPRQHFYRRADDTVDMMTARWSPWSKLDLEIESEYVLLFAMGRDAYLFWPIITPVVPATTADDSTPPKQWEIKLGWSRRKGGRDEWSPKQVADASLFFPNDQNLDPREAFLFLTQPAFDGVTVLCGGVRIITTGAVDPNTLRPRVSQLPISTRGVTTNDFVIWAEVTDNAGQPIANATVMISETSDAIIAGLAASAILPIPRGDIRTYTYQTGADGRIAGGVFPMLLSWSRRWVVTVSLPGGSSVEFAWPTACSYVVDTPGARTDRRRQEMTLRFVFSRKPVIVTSRQLGSFGCFSFERSGKVVAQSWPWAGSPSWLPPRNTTWSENAYVETAGSDDRLYLPELPNAAVVTRTPGAFRLRPLGQVPSDISSLYYFDGAGKRYQISFQTVSGTKTPVFTPTFHPFAAAYALALGVEGERTLLRRDRQQVTDGGATFRGLFLASASGGTSPTLGAASVPVEAVSFEAASFFGSYNWELFFHLPLAVATQLTRNLRFADAQRWLHYIYDPTSVEANAATPRYCWKFKPFFDAPPSQPAALFADLASLAEQLRVLRTDPFNPYAIARLRPVAFMKNVVMKYLDNLIAWGDQLFARDTMESITEATQLYLLAYQILGPRPPKVPSRARPVVQSYTSLAELARGQAPALSDLGAIAVAVSSFIPPSGPATPAGTPNANGGAPLGTMMYFCLPANDELSSYWDTVEDRLFKLRHCLDAKGRFRIPALFEPPIDPALLVRARAAGVDIADVLAEAAAPLPNYRFATLSQKATELAGELKVLGGALLGALEKRDGETLALLRERHEQSLFPLVEDVRRQQIDEAQAELEALQRSRESTVERWRYYLRLLGRTPPATVEGATTLGYLPVAIGNARGADTSGLTLSQHESQQLDWLDVANTFTTVGGVMNTLSGVLHTLPDSVYPVKWGGSHAGSAAEAVGAFFKLLSDNAAYQAGRAALVGGYARRQDDWILQHNIAVGELRQLERQIAAAEIRRAVAERELETHRKQVANAKEAETLLKTKFTNEQLYDWFVRQLSSLYFEAYRLANTVAKRAERAFRHELGRENTDFIRFGYWEDLRQGLLAGERLSQDLKRMEVAYLDEHAREYEITKHLSLASLDPSALLQLKATGVCEIVVPEWVFDLDYPGHYMRRVKSASLTIPCVVGPYAGVNCTVTLQSSSIRVNASSAAPYARRQQRGVPQDDSRFVDRLSAAQSIVTSSAQNDSGLFEIDLRDERYLPFEGHGVIGRWRIELPAASNSIDVNGISDVILHLRYTAREGGSGLAAAARAALEAILKPAAGASLFRLFSVRQEFPDQWHRFLSGNGTTLGPLDIGRRRFPLLFSKKKLSVMKARDYYVVDKNGIVPLEAVRTGGVDVTLQMPVAADRLAIDGLSQRVALDIDRTSPDTWPLDLLIVCRYQAED